MKKTVQYFKIFSICLAALLLFASCEKVQTDPMAYYPSIKTVSATVLADGSVQLTGQIVSPGTEPVDIAGFCLGTNPVPKMLDNQTIADISGNTFTATYTGFSIKTKYYFRSWAVNKNGYAYGDVISLDSVTATPLVAPCTPSMNTINIGAGTETIYMAGTPAYGVDGWDFSVSSNSVSMNITVGERPVTRIYTTTTSNSPGPSQIYINFYAGFISAAVDAGQSVYINQRDTSTWDVTICNASWSGSANGHMTAKFVVPK